MIVLKLTNYEFECLKNILMKLEKNYIIDTESIKKGD